MDKFTMALLAALLATLPVGILGCGGSAFTVADITGTADSGALGETTVDRVITIDGGDGSVTEEADNPEGEPEAGVDKDGSSDSPSAASPDSSSGSSDGSGGDSQTCVIQTTCATLCTYGPCCISSSACGCFNSIQARCFPL